MYTYSRLCHFSRNFFSYNLSMETPSIRVLPCWGILKYNRFSSIQWNKSKNARLVDSTTSDTCTRETFFVCLCVCVYVCMYVYVYVCERARVYVRVRVCVCVCVYARVLLIFKHWAFVCLRARLLDSFTKNGDPRQKIVTRRLLWAERPTDLTR